MAYIGPLSPHVNLNLNVRGLGLSATLAINERVREMADAGHETFRLGLGQSPFPVPAHVEKALAENAHQKDYLAVQGLPELREAIVGYLERTQGIAYAMQDVLVGPGTKELMFLLQLVYYGDLVIPSPSWVSYAPQAHIIGRHLRWLPTRIEDGLGVTPEALETLCAEDPDRPRLLILNYPGNPTGTSYAPEHLEALAAVCRRYKVLVLSDEIYSGTRFDGEHVSIARYYPEGTVISDGLSKWCGAGGWRLGAVVFPESMRWLLRAMAAVASETFTATSAPIQYAAVAGFRSHPEMDHYLTQTRRVLAALMGYGWRLLDEAGAECTRPRGAFYLFPNFEPFRERLAARGIHDGRSLAEGLLADTGVAVLPGEVFGRPRDELSARLALVDFDGAGALAAAARAGEGELDEAFLRDHCPRMVTALERTVDWLG